MRMQYQTLVEGLDIENYPEIYRHVDNEYIARIKKDSDFNKDLFPELSYWIGLANELVDIYKPKVDPVGYYFLKERDEDSSSSDEESSSEEKK